MPRQTKKKKRRVRIGRLIWLIVLVILVVALGATTGFVLSVARDVPAWNPEDMIGNMTTLVYDSDNKPVIQLHGVENRIPVDLKAVPQSLVNAFLATEDHRFFSHHGVDPQAIARAALTNFRSGSIAQGGSTITQQLAKNAFIEKPEKTLRRKVQEAILALQLEHVYTKEEILGYYLNQIYFGHGAYGVQAAAQTYFGKDVSQLDLAESAMLAGLVKSPGSYSPLKEGNLPQAKARQAQVLDNMVTYGYLTPEQAQQAGEEELHFRNNQGAVQKYQYPYFMDYVTDEAENLLEANGFDPNLLYVGGLNVYTSLDTRIQQKMEQVYSDPSNFPAGPKDQLVQSAMVVLEPSSGEVRGIVGGREHEVRRGWNRATQTKRQPGSSIKPLVVYAPAVEAGHAPATVVDDSPVTFPGNPPYSPENYDHVFRGLVNYREALRRSINVPAVKVLKDIGVDAGYEFGLKLGLPLVPEDKQLSLALGGVTYGVTPLQMAAAYDALANEGVWMQPHAVRRITDHQGRVLVEVTPGRKPVMSPQTAYLVTDMLQTVVKSGTGTQARLDGRPAAGKTGTTQLPEAPEFKGLSGNKDAWFIGYTPELVGAVWMGYDHTDQKHYLHNVAGGGYPARIWKAVMQEALKGVPVKEFPRPEGIVYVKVDVKSGLLPSNLTPPQFIVTEAFTTQSAPKKISQAWEEAQICTESQQLATPYCPQTQTGVFLVRPVVEGAGVEAYSLAKPREYCQIHGPGGAVAPGAQAGQVAVCADPRHQGQEYLANLPAPGESGGCPPEMIEYRRYPPGGGPQEKCPLPDHQITRPTQQTGLSGPPAPVLEARLEGPSVYLRWTASGREGLLFSLERWTRQEPQHRLLTSTKANTFADADLSPGDTYHYRVTAIDPDSNFSSFSNQVEVRVPASLP
ncbi:MAG: PBP1A family penicillin-binding protein [Clostridia bacterium]|nr:MAG: PBP1A family penicillin-binding protein [Clostridia bacterium]